MGSYNKRIGDTMIKYLPSDWVDDTSQNFNSEARFYIDPRGKEYPPISGTAVYEEVSLSSYWHKPGRFCLTSAMTYLMQTQTTFSAEIWFENFIGGVTPSNLIRFLGGYTITLRHNATGTYSLVLVGGTTVTLTGGATSPHPYQRVGFSMVYGGDVVLYVDGVAVDSDTAPALTTSTTTIEINGSANCKVSAVRLFDGYEASAADFLSSFDHVGNEEIYWRFQKESVGRTRCNINRENTHCVKSYSINRPAGYKSSSASVGLLNMSGEFNTDQFAAYAPEVGSYNGTDAQHYLARKITLEIETWSPQDTPLYPALALYPSTTLYPAGRVYAFDYLFKGSIPQGSFPRQTRNGGLSTVSLSAEDAMTDLGRKIARKSYKWEDYELAQADGSNSLFHELAQIVTRREFRNYLGNSGFENATICNSWLNFGTALTRDTTAVLAGTYCGKFTGISGRYFMQYASFDGEDSLAIGDVFTGSIWVYSASAIVGILRCGESLGSTGIAYTDSNYTHSGFGWEKWVVSHIITDATANRVRLTLRASTGGFTNVPVDCAMLKRGGDVDWWILNANDGTAGVISYEDAQEGTYDWVGVDTNDVDYVHPWAWVQKGDNVIKHLQELAQACAARVFRVDSAGVLEMESALTDDPPDSLGDLASGNAISGGLVPVMNAIELKGLCIEKKLKESNVWMAGASAGLKKAPTDTDGNFSRTVANGDQIPDEDSAVDNVSTYIAKYAQYEETRREEL